MTILSKKTLHLLCARAEVARVDLAIEAQKVVELCDDPHVAPEQKEMAKRELDAMIKEREAKIETTRRAKRKSDGHGPSPLPAV